MLNLKTRTGQNRAFTLIELLVVIAIIAIISVVVILTLNPAELLKQSRDATRAADLGVIDRAVSLANLENIPLGNASTVYVSVPDSTSTCTGLGFSALSPGWHYSCAPTSTYRSVNGTGWMPVAPTTLTSGSPLASFPVDPTNSTSTGFYYQYVTDRSHWQLVAAPESQKYFNASKTTAVQGYFSQGSQSTLFSPSLFGLVGYWKMDEGGTSAPVDSSGNNNTGTWNGAQAGTSGYYSAGKVGTFAGTFNGSNDYIDAGASSVFNIATSVTITAWIKRTSATFYGTVAFRTTGAWGNPYGSYGLQYDASSDNIYFHVGRSDDSWNNINAATPGNGTWFQAVGTYDGSLMKTYINGQLQTSVSYPGVMKQSAGNLVIGGGVDGGNYMFNGLIDDVRVYNRVLADIEILDLYNLQK